MIGIFSKTTDSSFVEVAGYSGLDFIIFDQEHGSIASDTLLNHIRAAKLTNIKSFVRVPVNFPHLISSALDAGADGVQIPNIASYEEALSAVKATRFHPLGMRGVCRFVRAAKYGTQERSSYFNISNNTTLILQVEGIDGVNALHDILSIDEFDILFIGPYDLSQSVGKPGEINHPLVLRIIKEIVKTAEKKKTIRNIC